METEKKTFDSELRQLHDFHSLNGVPPLGFFGWCREILKCS